MTLLALCALVLLAYTYLGYPAAIGALAKIAPAPRPEADGGYVPRVTICIPVHDGAAHIGAKLASLQALDWPADRLEILVYSDASTDATDDVVMDRATSDRRIRLLRGATRRGKPTALNFLRAHAHGEVLVLTDARQPLSPNALRELVAPLADPEIGCVAGNLVLRGRAASGAYWRYEKWIRENEARFRGAVGVSGALYALRREDFEPLPEDIILDDVWLPMRVRLAGRRTVFAPQAIAWDDAAEDDREFQRKVRTLAGNYQLFAQMPELLDPARNPAWFEIWSHKVLRLACPWALALLFLCSLAALPHGGPLALLAAAQIFVYGMALIGARAGRLGAVARTFVMMNAAAVVGLWRWWGGKQRVTW